LGKFLQFARVFKKKNSTPPGKNSGYPPGILLRGFKGRYFMMENP